MLDNINDDLSLIVSISLGEEFYLAYSVINKDNELIKIKKDFELKIKEKFKLTNFSNNGYELIEENIGKLKSLDFYNCNENYLKTYDKEEFEKFTDKCVKKLKEFLEKK